MEKKYIGSTVALPLDTAKALDDIQKFLAAQHGIEFSKSQVIAYLCHYHCTREKAAAQQAQRDEAAYQTEEGGE